MMELIVTLRLNDNQHYATQNSNKNQHKDTVMLIQNVIMLNVIMLNVIVQSVNQFSC